MRRKLIIVMAIVMGIMAGGCAVFPPEESETKIVSLRRLEDQIRGGWTGKMFGVEYGMPTEFKAKGCTYDKELAWKPEMIQGALRNDDLYVQLSFMMTMDKEGVEAPAASYGKRFADCEFGLCHANRKARKNIWDSIMPPDSGSPQYSMHSDDIDFQIEADFIGFMHPGMPQSSNKMCDKLGHIICHGDGVYGGMFVSAMHSSAFFDHNVESVVHKGLAAIPGKSQYAQCISDVIKLHKKYPNDWKKCWTSINKKWLDSDMCVPFHPLSIDAKLNGAFIAIGLLYGEGDFDKTMEISIRCGQDSDCNPSNAAAVLGIMYGYKAIPDKWKSGLNAIKNKEFIYTDYTFEKAVTNTLKYACQFIEENGGRVENGICTVKQQLPAPPKNVEISYPGLVPVEKILVTDNRWNWDSCWWDQKIPMDNRAGKRAQGKGSTCTLDFEGTGILVLGAYTEDGGKAKVYIDNQFIREIDNYYRGEAGCQFFDNAAHLFSKINLEPGKHQLKIVITGTKKPESKGTRIWIDSANIFTSK